MRIHRTVAAVATTALLLGAVGCDNDSLTNVNRNPNAPERVGTGLLFTSGTVGAVNLVRGSLEVAPQSPASTWPQYIGEFQYPEISYYVFRPTTADALWLQFYASPLQDFEQARRQATEANRPNEIGPILTMRAWTYSYMTGMWGDIPFTEANKADQGNITPTYDTQQRIYDSLLTNLADVNQMMGASAAGNLGGQDPIYGGSAAQWKKFANSLRARLGLNLSKADAARARTEVSAAIAAGGFTSNADNAELHWPGDGVNDNPWHANQLEGSGTRDDVRMAATFIDTLRNFNDPRLAVFARPIPGGGYAGMPHGIEAEDAAAYNNAASKLGTQIFAATQPSYLMTYAEFSFIKAEAAHRGWIAGGAAAAAQYYNEGIRASMEQWGVADAAITAYLAQPRVTFNPVDGPASGLAQIMLQKWLAAFTAGFEAWSDWRRTGLPVFRPAVAARTNPAAIPRRVIYPQTEQSFNDPNLKAAIASQGPDDLMTRMWIDKP